MAELFDILYQIIFAELLANLDRSPIPSKHVSTT